MEIDYKHGLPADDARARLEALADYLGNKWGIKIAWTAPERATFSGRYMVVKIQGELTLREQVVQFRGEDPGFLWRKKASEYITYKLKTYLDPQVQLADLPRG
ncbi:MAG: polyhydroxyalkanoic acid system family protein [Kofleriaceae bacterium]